MKRSILAVFCGLVMSVGACSNSKSDDKGLSASGGNKTSSSKTTTAGNSDSGNGDGGGESGGGDDSTNFLGGSDAPPSVASCDPWSQGCNAGEKCVAYKSPGATTWDKNRCVPVDANPKRPGDACTVKDNNQSGLDDCDATSTCNWVQEGSGICAQFCTGTADSPQCAQANHSCNIDNEGSRILCNPICNPLGDGMPCPDESRQTCLQANGSEGFNCELGWGEGATKLGEACEFDNACQKGALCWFTAAEVPYPECMGAAACCTTFCDLTEAKYPADAISGTTKEKRSVLTGNRGSCQGPETITCETYYTENPPPELLNLGVCRVPTAN